MKEKISLRERVHEVIFEADTPSGKLFDVVLFWLIIISVLAVILESVKAYDRQFHLFFKYTEWIVTVVFTIEYFLRIYSIKKPVKYIFSFYGIIDLLSILPAYLSLIFSGTHTLAIIRVLRLFRIFRVFKITRYLSEGSYLKKALMDSRRKIFIFVVGVGLLVIVLGAVMYLIEGGQDSGFVNIPVSIYWAIVTLTTVGYGDISPTTPLGQFVASVIMLIGYGIIAVPTGIVTAELAKHGTLNTNTQSCSNCNFSDHADDAKFCKRCGESLNL
ncbi:MAG: ion transporter [Bacteroidetes bacterium]|nr:ion transporter [Bacteroidota bacterium]